MVAAAALAASATLVATRAHAASGSPRVLPRGLWVYWYAESDPAPYWTADQIADRAIELGFTGVIIHSGSLDLWRSTAERVGPGLAARGLSVATGIGLDPSPSEAGDWTAYRARCADAILSALAMPWPVVLDWEGAWESTSTGGADAHRDDARWIVERVLSRRPDSVGRVCDVPWWKPSVHSSAPTAEFGRLCGWDRYVQAYGAARTADGETIAGVEGRTARMLAQSRTTEYPAFCRRNSLESCYEIMACVQGYKRSVADHRNLLRQEFGPDGSGSMLYWHLLALDDAAKTALRSWRE